MTNRSRITLSAALLAASVAPALAHVDLVTDESPVGEFVGTFQVPHGCSGAATTAIRIQIPSGAYDVKPEPVPGWKLDMKTGKYATPFTDGGQSITSGVTEVDYTAGNLPDNEYQQFLVYMTLADSLQKGTKLYFPVVQECGKNVVRWIQIPEAGKSEDDYPNPAAALTISAGPDSDADQK